MPPKWLVPKAKAKPRAKAMAVIRYGTALRVRGDRVPIFLQRLQNFGWFTAKCDFNQKTIDRVASYVWLECTPTDKQRWVTLMWDKMPTEAVCRIHAKYRRQHDACRMAVYAGVGKGIYAGPAWGVHPSGQITGFA